MLADARGHSAARDAARPSLRAAVRPDGAVSFLPPPIPEEVQKRDGV